MNAIDAAIDRLQAEAAKIGDQVDLRRLVGSAYVQAQTTQALLGALVNELGLNGGLDRGRYDAAVAQRLTELADRICGPGDNKLIVPN